MVFAGLHARRSGIQGTRKFTASGPGAVIVGAAADVFLLPMDGREPTRDVREERPDPRPEPREAVAPVRAGFRV